MITVKKMIEFLKEYRLQNTVDHDDEHTIELVDVFTPDGDDIDSGTGEVELLADHLCSCIYPPGWEDWEKDFAKEFHDHYDGILTPELVEGGIQWNLEFLRRYINGS